MSISQGFNLKPRRLNLKLDQIIISYNYKHAEKIYQFYSPSQLICSEWAKVLTSISCTNIGYKSQCHLSISYLTFENLGLIGIEWSNQASRHSGGTPKTMSQAEVDARPDCMGSGDYHKNGKKKDGSGGFGRFLTHTVIPWFGND
jgi:hypothetical protein